MQFEVYEIINGFCNNYKDELVAVHMVTGENKMECFKYIYALEMRSRYDNERRYEIADPDIEREYKEWRQHGIAIEIHCSATVD